MKPLLAIMLLLAPLTACSGQKGASQKADLAFLFRCKERANPALEQKVAFFLQSKGFRVLNLGALAREHRVDIYDLDITAIDAKQRIVDINAFRESPGSQTLGLYSAPPTKHDPALEASLLNFASQTLGCTTDQVTRNNNGPEAAELHAWNVHRIEGLFKEASTLNGPGA
jgi:hypothetical protein